MDTITKMESLFLVRSVFPEWREGVGVHHTGNLCTRCMCFFFVYEFIYKMLSKNALWKKFQPSSLSSWVVSKSQCEEWCKGFNGQMQWDQPNTYKVVAWVASGEDILCEQQSESEKAPWRGWDLRGPQRKAGCRKEELKGVLRAVRWDLMVVNWTSGTVHLRAWMDAGRGG